MNAALPSRLGVETPRQLSAGVRQKARLAQANTRSPIPGTGGRWTPYGKGPLIFDDPKYPAANGDGFGKVNGRINEFAFNTETRTLYAAVAQGGVWRSTDMGENWTPIGENLPIASTGSVALDPGARRHADRRHRRPRVLERLRGRRRLHVDRRGPQLGEGRGRAGRPAVVPPRGRPDRSVADLLRVRRRALPLRRHGALLHQREPADGRVRGRLRQAQLLLRQHRHGRHRPAEGQVRPRGRRGAGGGRVASRPAAELQQQARRAGQRPLQVGQRHARLLQDDPGLGGLHPVRARGPRGADRGVRAGAGLRLRVRDLAGRGAVRQPARRRRPRRAARRHAVGAGRDLRVQRLRRQLGGDGEPPGVLQPVEQLGARPADGARHRPGLPGHVQHVHRAGPDASGQRRTDARDPRHGGGLADAARPRACPRAATRSSP